MINPLSVLLEKFKNLKDPKEEREKIAGIISRQLGFEISEDQISLRNGVLSINADNYLKSEIFMNKVALLEVLKKENFLISEIR